METTEISKKNNSVGLLAGLLTGAGIVAATWLIASRSGRITKENSISYLFDKCNKSVSQLENRVQASG